MVQERLVRAVAEQMKLPLLQIARSAELAAETGNLAAFSRIAMVSDAALKVLDGFLLAQSQPQAALHLEPVSVASVLNDTAHKLEQFAGHNDCDIEISINGRYAPAMAHKETLESALLLLGYGLIESRPTDTNKRHRVIFATHRSAKGLVAGVFDNQSGMSADVFRRGKALFGNARQALPSVSGTNGASIFIADTLFTSMATPLRVAKHDRHTGLAATLNQSQQLRLVA